MLIGEDQTRSETAFRFAFEPLKVPAHRFHAMLKWLAQQPDVPPQVAIALQAAAWLVEVDAFREREEQLMREGKYEETLPEHRVCLSDLIATGEAILLVVKKLGMNEGPIKFTVEDLQATLDLLHTSFRCEHGPKNSQKTNTLIAQLFDGSKS